MKIVVLGSGNYDAAEGNFHTNFAIEENGRYLLVDCGSDIRHSLRYSNIDVDQIDAVYISHLHADHCGGLEWLAYKTFFSGRKIKLFMSAWFEDDFWLGTLYNGMKVLSGEKAADGADHYFDTNFVSDRHFNWEGLHFELMCCDHIVGKGNIHPSYGIVARGKGYDKSVFFTTDMQFVGNERTNIDVWMAYNAVDLIFQDCETYYDDNGTPIRSGVHAHFSDLRTLPSEIKSKMKLVHYGYFTNFGGVINLGWFNKHGLSDFNNRRGCAFVAAGQIFEPYFNSEVVAQKKVLDLETF